MYLAQRIQESGGVCRGRCGNTHVASRLISLELDDKVSIVRLRNILWNSCNRKPLNPTNPLVDYVSQADF